MNTVRSLLQTHDGYLWVGTKHGLARFDGVQFKVFTEELAIEEGGDLSCQELREDALGRLWVRLPALIRASLEAATPPATVKRKIELLFRDQPGLPPPSAAIPVEIVAGAWDLVAPLAGARRLASHIPGAKVQVVDYVGHAGAYTRPRVHLDAVIAALNRMA